METSQVIVCPDCKAQVPQHLLCCPICKRLLYAARVKELLAEADRAGREEDAGAQLAALRQALELLPQGSRQHEAVAERVNQLSGKTNPWTTGKRPASGPGATRWWAGAPAGIAVLLLLAWKFKVVLILLLGKAKFLLLGLTKMGTLFSMLASFGVYWKAYGWVFALGLVLSIYVHEMGHVHMLGRFGIRATAPMFIPGFGALILLRQRLANVREEALTGLAGPLWGMGAAIGSMGLYYLTGWPALAAIAVWGARLNLFNLIPVWQLDGSHGFAALSRRDRLGICVLAGVLWLVTHEVMLLPVLFVGLFRCFSGDQKADGQESQGWVLWLFVVLIVVLPLLCLWGTAHAR